MTMTIFVPSSTTREEFEDYMDKNFTSLLELRKEITIQFAPKEVMHYLIFGDQSFAE